jgi:hypothetical protein
MFKGWSQSVCAFLSNLSYVEEKFRTHPVFAYDKLLEKFPKYHKRLLFWTPEFCAASPEQIDFILTLGGDGTGMLLISW